MTPFVVRGACSKVIQKEHMRLAAPPNSPEAQTPPLIPTSLPPLASDPMLLPHLFFHGEIPSFLPYRPPPHLCILTLVDERAVPLLNLKQPVPQREVLGGIALLQLRL